MLGGLAPSRGLAANERQRRHNILVRVAAASMLERFFAATVGFDVGAIELPSQAAARLRRMCDIEELLETTAVQRWVTQRWDAVRNISCVRPSGSDPAINLASTTLKGDAIGARVAGDGGVGGDRCWGGGTAFQEEARRLAKIGLEAEVHRLSVALGAEGLDAKASEGILATWTTGGRNFVEQALNFGLSIRRNEPSLERRFVVLSLDEAAHVEMRNYGFRSILHNTEAWPHASGSEKLVDVVWKFRWILLLAALRQGIDIVVTDSDIVLAENPFPYFVGDSDLELSTEHLFPERHLWKQWTRPEDDLSTGVIFARGASRKHDGRDNSGIVKFLTEFLVENWQASVLGGVLRDPFDQRVFNQFVRSRASSCDPCIVGVYGHAEVGSGMQTGNDDERVAEASFGAVDLGFAFGGSSGSRTPSTRWEAEPLRLRVVDSVRVAANGVNYFWRKAHRLHADRRPPALAHANGVGPKEYFLRDRGVWYLDDLAYRFGTDPRFLQYEHPRGLSVGEDFGYLSAALEVARGVGRRLVLPATMNCQNCPAYKVYNLDSSLGYDAGCTIDYFAYMLRFLNMHQDDVVEAGVARRQEFNDLWGPAQSFYIPDSDLAARDVLTSKAALLSLSGDVRELRRALRLHGASAAEGCSYHEWPHRFMACRDDAFVARFGETMACSPENGQSGCGQESLICCVSHHGRADRLQYYTGKAWDLPCNCGLDAACEEFPFIFGRSNTAEAGGTYASGTRCCRPPSASPSVNGRCTWALDAQIGDEVAPEGNPEKDLPFYNSCVLAKYVNGYITASDVWRECSRHRRVYFLVREPLEGLPEADCNILVSAYLIARQNFTRARDWWSFSLKLRRDPGHTSLTVSLETGEPDNLILDRGKLFHDFAQFRYMDLDDAADRLDQLLKAYDRVVAGVGSRSDIVEAMSAALPVFNRALHIPADTTEDCSIRTLDWMSGSSVADLRQLSVPRKGSKTVLATAFGALGVAAVEPLAERLRRSTVWYNSRGDGQAVEAQLRDGLHAAAFTTFAELCLSLLPSTFAGAGLVDLRARSYGAWSANNLSLGPEYNDADLSILIVVGGGSANSVMFRVAGSESELLANRGQLQMLRTGSVAAWTGRASLWYQITAEVRALAFEQRVLVMIISYDLPSLFVGKSTARLYPYLHEHDPALFKYRSF